MFFLQSIAIFLGQDQIRFSRNELRTIDQRVEKEKKTSIFLFSITATINLNTDWMINTVIFIVTLIACSHFHKLLFFQFIPLKWDVIGINMQ